MAFEFTPAQQKVLDARNHNILVSAAAGSGKTAVLVERIVRLITEGEHPLDIDSLLVVTFTRAAAAQMRERIGEAISARLAKDPVNAHLQRQAVLLHNAQITTMDSFFTFLLRNYFSEIDLDPGFRQIDPAESAIIAADVMQKFLEEKYEQKDPAFSACVAYFCTGIEDGQLEELILELHRQAGSHPSPEEWIRQRASDYDVPDEEALFSTPWMRAAILRTAVSLMESDSCYGAMEDLCRRPGGPDACLDFLHAERENLFGELRPLLQKLFADQRFTEETMDPAGFRTLWEAQSRALSTVFATFPALRGKKYDYMDPALKKAVKSMRDAEKNRIKTLGKSVGGRSVQMILATMEVCRDPVKTLTGLALEFSERLQARKKELHVIDFVDLEHFALDILAQRMPDGTWLPRRAAKALRSHYAEILIDEYQDSNEVQEVLLQILSGEEDGRYNRFMVGDIKQSIYRFRLARPEIFMEKYDAYRPGDPLTQLIELDQNFRSRKEVLDCVNAVFSRIMRREVGGVEYSQDVSLKEGAVFPDTQKDGPHSADLYRTELLLLDTGDASEDDDPEGAYGADAAEEEEDSQEESAGILKEEIGSLTDKQKEALLIAGRIRRMVGVLPVRDEKTGQMRPARYGDMVILLRGTRGWSEDLRAVFEREGIPSYAESRTGYFAAEEIRVVLQMLRVIDNPRQDIPLYGAMRGFFGNFSQEEIARVRLVCRDGLLYDALCAAAGLSEKQLPDAGHREQDDDGLSLPLADKCRDFLAFLRTWRRRAQFSTIAGIVSGLLEETGYTEYCTALPAGLQRAANLRILRSQADAFAGTDFSGLFQFLRYIDGLKKQEIDLGEANILDENADVVRIMTIHKSKGLEFPVCFVAGLAGRISSGGRDVSGPMLLDSDWGAGIHYYDTSSRVRMTTMRREEIAEKIRRDSMGEELRVLYVAMTRAKEKLILTAAAKGVRKKLEKWQNGMAGYFASKSSAGDPGQKLPPSMISGAGSYAQLICEAVYASAGPDAFDAQPSTGLTEGEFPMRIRMLTTEDLTMQAVQEQMGLSRVEELLRAMEGRPLTAQPDPAAAQALADRIFRVYPHEELRGLYAQTSVSEIKHRAMLAAPGQMESDSTETSAELFPETVPVPYIPSFIREEKPAADGARRGTAFHRILELIDFCRRRELSSMDVLRDWILQLTKTGMIRQEDASLVRPQSILAFLQSPVAARMEAADKRGQLYREQPFVLGCPADRLREDFPKEETITVQGIIDAFFIEEDRIVLIDYKTDRVQSPQELTDRYRTQLELYAQALEQAFRLPVAERILYSASLEREILL